MFLKTSCLLLSVKSVEPAKFYVFTEQQEYKLDFLETIFPDEFDFRQKRLQILLSKISIPKTDTF